MRKYNGRRSILDETLGEYKDYGFSLVEPDSLFTELYFKDKRVAIYNQDKVTFDTIREGCRNYMTALSRWS